MQLGNFTNVLSVLILSVVGSLTWSYEAMIIGRFLMGIPLGLYYSKFVFCRPDLRVIWRIIRTARL